MLFSQRKGLKPMSKDIQRESLDQELRGGLWSCFHVCYLKRWNGRYNSLDGSNLETLFLLFWHSFFKFPVDNLDLDNFSGSARRLRELFFKASWNEVYDFIEFTVKNAPEQFAESFRDMVNEVLERENSAYRFVTNNITEITSDEEIEAIESAIQDTSAIAGVRVHLRQALQHLSDRKSRDYRNSIKESISAVEALCQRVAGEPDTSLGKALKALEPKVVLHPALRDAFSKLYGYTSNAGGIRHAMMDETELSFSDAKFMLVTCSAFINYVLGKCAETGKTL